MALSKTAQLRSTPAPLVSIFNSTFYRVHPSNPSTAVSKPWNSNRALFPNLSFTLSPHSKWALVSEFSAAKAAFLDILQGKYICDPPKGRTYPHFANTGCSISSGIRLVTFGGSSSSAASGGGGLLGGSTANGGYISARYESLRQENDISLSQWLVRGTELNPGEEVLSRVDTTLLGDIARELKLDKLMDQPIMTLSNGQARRAVMASVLLKRPYLVLLDEIFMGLDPPSTALFSHLLEKLSQPSQPTAAATKRSRLSITPFLALHPQDPLPKWIEQIVYLSKDYNVISLGPKEQVASELSIKHNIKLNTEEIGQFKEGLFKKVWGSIGFDDTYTKPSTSAPTLNPASLNNSWIEGHTLVRMANISVSYGAKSRKVLTNFSWKISRGDRWGVFGPNGSGKTTLLSLLTSNHPQSYSQTGLFLFSNVPRSEPGIPLFDIQKRIGISSPEIHSFFPVGFGLKRAVISAFGETFLSNPKLNEQEKENVNEVFNLFGDLLPEFNYTSLSEDPIVFSSLSLSQQRLLLFMRAIVRKPDLLILDEAFSGMDGVARKRCLDYLENKGMFEESGGLSKDQALVMVSHKEIELPSILKGWVRLRGDGEEAVFGDL